MSKKDRNVTQEEFDELLAWLDSDREAAARKYEDIRSRIIRIFTCRGWREPEEIADETFNRVAKKVRSISETYSGDPALYFFAVANHVYQEYLRRPKVVDPPPENAPAADNKEDVELEFQCLEQCVEHLPPENRELIVEYYQESRQIEVRKRLAQRLGLALSVLRVRAHRIRAILYSCVQNCLEKHDGVK